MRFSGQNKKFAVLALVFHLLLVMGTIPFTRVGAADHGDAPGASVDRSADINDVYLFLDPNDNSKVVILMTVHGFIVPAEAVNFGVFDQNLRYRFNLEANGDTEADGTIDVVFSEKMTSGATPQTATVSSSFFPTFTAPTSLASTAITGPPAVVTTDAGTGIAFYAGLSDDPFTFDIPAFGRYTASVIAGAPNPAFFNRGRDSFAGYNTLSLGLSIPVELLRSRLNVLGHSIGLFGQTQRRISSVFRAPNRSFAPNYYDVDRMGIPAINVALIPFTRKNEYNLATPTEDATGRFADSIIGSLTALGTNTTNIGVLATVAVLKGDYLRLDLNKANTGSGSGTVEGAGFPNGRRLADDVVDTIMFFVSNQHPLTDNANVNDVPFRNQFPFFGAAQQPRESGDDNTKN